MTVTRKGWLLLWLSCEAELKNVRIRLRSTR
jgi:hypothetical protein